MLNPQSPIPLYHQLADVITEAIRSGDYAPGTRIPSEPQLARDHGIGRPTVRQAIELLARRGMLEKRRGSGTYVREQTREIDLFSLAGTSSAFQKKGIQVASHLLAAPKLIRVDEDKANPFSGGKAFFFSRINRVDNTPVLMEAFYLHPELFKGIEALELEGESLSRVVETHFYLKPTDGRQTFHIGYLDQERATAMAVGPRTPMLIVHRHLNFEPAKSAIFSILYCNTKTFVFSQRIGGLNHEK